MATYTNLNIARLADGALEAFVKALLPLNTFSRSYSPEAMGRARGNVVLVPLIGTLTATTFGGTYAVCGGTKSVITVTINKHKVVHIGQTDLDALNNSESSLDSLSAQAGAALGQMVVEEVLSLVTTGNFGAAGSAVASTALDVPGLRALNLALNQANAPREMRGYIMDVVGMDALLAVTNFVNASFFADNTVLREGRVMRAIGNDIYTVNGSFVAANSINLFLAHPSAIAVAMRYLQPQNPEEYTDARAVADPRTGATFGIRDMFDPLTGTRYVALEANFGYAVGISNAARILKRTD